MRERGAALMAAAELFFGKMHAMRQHGAPSDQAMMIIDIEIILAIGKEVGGPFDLALVLGDVRMHQDVLVFAPERARGLELLRRRSAGKARRDRIEAAGVTMPPRDQRL